MTDASTDITKDMPVKQTQDETPFSGKPAAYKNINASQTINIITEPKYQSSTPEMNTDIILNGPYCIIT